jgi:hypothetical protein
MLNTRSDPRFKPTNALWRRWPQKGVETFRSLGSNIITTEHFAALHCKGSYVNVPEMLSYDKIEDGVLDIALFVTDQHLARDVETRARVCGLQCCRLVNQG